MNPRRPSALSPQKPPAAFTKGVNGIILKKSRNVNFTNLEKVFFSEPRFTKGDLIRFYVAAAPYLLPHLRHRPVTLIRFPDGVSGGHFYEKNVPSFAPPWIKTTAVPRRHHAGITNYIVIDDIAALAWCANLAAIELHPFLHRAPKLDQPTSVAFDLDPGEGATLLTCIRVAFLIKNLMSSLKLEVFPKVSGSKGLQLHVPLNTPVTYEATSAFAKAVAELLSQEQPQLVVSSMTKTLRRGRVLIDWSQNSASKTTVSVYSVRGKSETPLVSMPVTWGELKKTGRDERVTRLLFTPADCLTRLRKTGDLFAPVLTLKQRLPKAFARLKSQRPTSTALQAYEAKRDFSQTAEPSSTAKKQSTRKGKNHFVIQKHAASRLHYDLRLEMDGTLKSWAVPKGVPTEPGVKRAAFAVEDHPLDYMRFEGTIPKGQYGGGTVMVWDIGTYELLEGDYASGQLKLRLGGKKLRGEWHLFKIRGDGGKDVWLIVKSGQAAKAISARRDDMSVLTRRSMARIAKDNAVQWKSRR